jgi:hypothetical protein
MTGLRRPRRLLIVVALVTAVAGAVLVADRVGTFDDAAETPPTTEPSAEGDVDEIRIRANEEGSPSEEVMVFVGVTNRSTYEADYEIVVGAYDRSRTHRYGDSTLRYFDIGPGEIYSAGGYFEQDVPTDAVPVLESIERTRSS